MARVVSARLSIKERRRRRILIVCGSVFGALLAIFLLCWAFLNASFVRITNIEISGTDVLPVSTVKEAVEHSMEGNYVHLFSKNSIFLYPKAGIAQDLRRLFPTLKTVSVNAKDFHTVAVVVSERTPAALWCPSTSSDPTGGTQDTTLEIDSSDATVSYDCALLDEDGLAYANAPQYSGKVYQQYFGTLPLGPLPKQFLKPEQFRSLSALAKEFEKKLAPDVLDAITVDDNNDVHLSFDGAYEVLFALEEDTGVLFDRFSLTLTAAPFTEHKLSDFMYVDLRFGDKVYYKLKSE